MKLRCAVVLAVLAAAAAVTLAAASTTLSPEGDAAAAAAGRKYKPGDRPLTKDLTAEELGMVDSQIKELEDFFAAGNNKDLKPGEKRKYRRAFHAKGFCLRAKVKIDGSSSNSAYKQGIYAKQGTEYSAWVRWSNGLGSVNPDAMPDVRGMAVKIFTEGENNKDKSLDLLATNGPVPTNNSPQTLAEFQLTMANSGLFALASQASKSVSYFWKHPMTLKLLLRTVPNPPRSFAREQFWSGSPYKVGGSIVKFNFRPEDSNAIASDPANGKNRLLDLSEDNAEVADDKAGVLAALKHWYDAIKRLKKLALDKDYLKNDMRDRAKSKSISYKIQLQLFKDEKTTPTEDLFTEWRESDAPSTPVATLTIPQQEWDEKLQEECENASFNPMHAALDHSPYGHVNTARNQIYSTSHQYRHEKNEL